MSSGDVTDAEGSAPSDRRSRRRVVVITASLLAVAGLAVWAFVAGSILLDGRERAERGRDALAGLSALEPLDADFDQVHDDVAAAAVELSAARRRLTSPWLAPLRPLPVVGRQLASARALATTAESVLVPARSAVEHVVAGRDDASDPAERLELLAAMEDDLSRLAAAIDGADLGPDEALVAPLADARFDAAQQLAELDTRVDEALLVVRGLRSLMGRSSYVVLAANPAEMANTGGMYLSVGELRAEGGEFELDEFRHASELFPVPHGPTGDAEVAQRWGHVVPADDFRKLNLTLRFADYVGPLGVDMWERSTGRRAQGAIVVDPVVVQALLRVVGPVEVEGRTYDADALVSYALVEQYTEFAESGEQGERRELVTAIARAAVDAMGERSWDPLDLVRQLRIPASGRHLLAYSENPAEQAMWSAIGVDGALTGDELLVNVGALAGHKIDALVNVAVAGSVRTDGRERIVELSVEVQNTTPAGIAGFAAGAPELVGAEPGSYVGRLVVFTPSGTRAVRFTTPRSLEAAGSDGPVWVTATRFVLPPGASETFEIEVVLDASTEELVVLPSARVPPITWSMGGESWTDVERRTVPLG